MSISLICQIRVIKYRIRVIKYRKRVISSVSLPVSPLSASAPKESWPPLPPATHFRLLQSKSAFQLKSKK